MDGVQLVEAPASGVRFLYRAVYLPINHKLPYIGTNLALIEVEVVEVGMWRSVGGGYRCNYKFRMYYIIDRKRMFC